MLSFLFFGHKSTIQLCTVKFKIQKIFLSELLCPGSSYPNLYNELLYKLLPGHMVVVAPSLFVLQILDVMSSLPMK